MDNVLSPVDAQSYARQRPARAAVALRPEGHNAFWEGARPWLVFLGATAMAIISVFVIAQDSLIRLLSGTGSLTDGLVVFLSGAVGALLDAAIVISGMRTHQERGVWVWLACIMFVLCIGVEMMTLAYFYKIIAPASVPAAIRPAIDSIHDSLYFFRAGLPPLAVAYFGVAVRNLVYGLADRKRQMKEATGARLMDLEGRLADPANVEPKADLIRDYETQLHLFEYANDATDGEKAANAALIGQFKETWGMGKKADEMAALRAELTRFQEAAVRARDEAQYAIEAERQAAAQSVESLRTQAAQAFAQLKSQTEQTIEGERQHLAQLLTRALLMLATARRLPDEVLALDPSLAEIDWSAFAQKPARKPATKPATTNDELSAILAELGIEAVAKPVESSRDLWVKTAAIEALSGSFITGDAARKLAKSQSQMPGKDGENYKQGLAYIMPLRPLIRELAARNQLVSPVLSWWKARDKGPAYDGETGEYPAIIEDA